MYSLSLCLRIYIDINETEFFAVARSRLCNFLNKFRERGGDILRFIDVERNVVYFQFFFLAHASKQLKHKSINWTLWTFWIYLTSILHCNLFSHRSLKFSTHFSFFFVFDLFAPNAFRHSLAQQNFVPEDPNGNELIFKFLTLLSLSRPSLYEKVNALWIKHTEIYTSSKV